MGFKPMGETAYSMGGGKGEKKRITKQWSKNQYEVCSLCGDSFDRRSMESATRCIKCSELMEKGEWRALDYVEILRCKGQ